MTESNETAAPVTGDLTDAQVDKYFETGGNDIESSDSETQSIEVHENEAERTASNGEQIAVSKDERDDKSASKSHQDDSVIGNYKSMAHEERERRKEAQKRVDELANENKKLRETFEKLIASSEKQQEVPSFDDNPLEALRHENETIKKQLAGLNQTESQRQEYSKQQESMQQFVRNYAEKATEFAKTTPDFKEAYSYVMQSRMEEFIAAGYSKQDALNLVHEDEAAIVANAFRQDANPAERIYKLAELRGYKKSSKEQDIKSANKQKIDSLEKGIKASATITNSGSHNDSKLTLEAIADMSDDEFDKVDWNKVLKLG